MNKATLRMMRNRATLGSSSRAGYRGSAVHVRMSVQVEASNVQDGERLDVGEDMDETESKEVMGAHVSSEFGSWIAGFRWIMMEPWLPRVETRTIRRRWSRYRLFFVNFPRKACFMMIRNG